MNIAEARAQDILGFHRIHRCGQTPCTCYDDLREQTLEVIENWDRYKDAWIIVAVRFENRFCGAARTASEADDWRQQLDMDNLEENFYLIAPAAHSAKPFISGNVKIIDRHRNEFSFDEGRTAVFTPYSEGAVMNEAGIPGQLDEVAVTHPVQLLKELATFCGFEVIPRALSVAEQPVNRDKWYIVEQRSKRRIRECETEAEALDLARTATVPPRWLAVQHGSAMAPPSTESAELAVVDEILPF